MKTLLAVVGGVSLALALSQTPRAKGWRGLVPLRSTRAEVVSLLGQPDKYGRYDFDGERAQIFYATHTCSDGGQWNVPLDTVTSISVWPKGGLKLSDLRLDLGKFEKSADPQRTYYLNRQEGVMYAVVEPGGEVMEIYYQPAAEDEHLRCPNWRPPPTCNAFYDPCPVAEITDRNKPCSGSAHELSVSVAGLAAEETLTFTWTVSEGEITDGQGTSSVTIDTASAGGKPVKATLKITLALCEACNIEESYTIEPCPKGKPAKGGRRKP